MPSIRIFTLGDLEARKKEIRARLQREGVFEQNKLVPSPWDFTSVVVVAPHEAAGLGDFRKESDRLAQYGICRFAYAHSRFHGEGAAREIIAALTESWTNAPPLTIGPKQSSSSGAAAQ